MQAFRFVFSRVTWMWTASTGLMVSARTICHISSANVGTARAFTRFCNQSHMSIDSSFPRMQRIVCVAASSLRGGEGPYF